MLTFKPSEYGHRLGELEGWAIAITSYRLQDRFFCKIDNVSPGAIIARAQADSMEEAEAKAFEAARRRLAATRRHPLTA
ncbi:MAG: hypothetical protein WBV82_09025 [Myxococcaceae bacterium]